MRNIVKHLAYMFHTCMQRNSLRVALTWLPVSTELSRDPLAVFQNLNRDESESGDSEVPEESSKFVNRDLT